MVKVCDICSKTETNAFKGYSDLEIDCYIDNKKVWVCGECAHYLSIVFDRCRKLLMGNTQG